MRTASPTDLVGTSESLTPDRLREEVAALPWYHRIDLGHGIVTPGMDPSPARVRWLEIPADLRDWTVLDVGSWDGFYAFEAERRGAKRVLATDSHVWRGATWGSKRSFDLARRALKSGVEDLEIDVMELSADRVGVFDLVLFLGVLYHLKHPLLALERVAEVTGRQLVLETHVDLLGLSRPAAAFYPGSELQGDPSNWWGFNPAGVEALLRTVGFREVRRVHVRPAVASRALLDDVRSRGRPATSPAARLRQGRAVFHAFK